jgi:hypothetical protein
MELDFELDQGANVEGQGREASGFRSRRTALIVDSTFELAIADLDQSGNQQ